MRILFIYSRFVGYNVGRMVWFGCGTLATLEPLEGLGLLAAMKLLESVDWWNLLILAGGIALFMYGMYQMGEGLAHLADGRMKSLLRRATESPVKAVLTGAGVTAVIQSSSATTVMVVQLVDAGLMDLGQAAGVIMGANIGTCVTAWMLGAGTWLDELLSGRIFGTFVFSAFLLNFLLVFLLALFLIFLLTFLSVILTAFIREKRFSTIRLSSRLSSFRILEFRRGGRFGNSRGLYSILWGLVLLLLGMKAMQAGTAPLAEMPAFCRMLTQFENPIHGVAAGALFTAVIQSSSASVGILQALSGTGVVRYGVAIPVILGQNIGTCATALLSCIGAGRTGRYAAFLHLGFNVVGVGIFLFGFYGAHRIWGFTFLEQAADARGIALVHTVFNVLMMAACLPFLWCGKRDHLYSKTAARFLGKRWHKPL